MSKVDEFSRSRGQEAFILCKMARPPKNNCDYFPHDRDMRNHRKIKAIRTKFGIQGYAIWSMLLEYLTGSDGNKFHFLESEIELIAGDFGVSATEISDVVNYCVKLELLFINDGFINSNTLDERLLPVYEKRAKNKNNSSIQPRSNGKFASKNTEESGVSVTEMPQIKRKEIKENNINNNNGGWESEKNQFLQSSQFFYKQCTEFRLKKEEIMSFASDYLKELELGEDYKGLKELKLHFSRWVRKKVNNPIKKINGFGLTDYQKELEEKRKNFKVVTDGDHI